MFWLRSGTTCCQATCRDCVVDRSFLSTATVLRASGEYLWRYISLLTRPAHRSASTNPRQWTVQGQAESVVIPSDQTPINGCTVDARTHERDVERQTLNQSSPTSARFLDGASRLASSSSSSSSSWLLYAYTGQHPRKSVADGHVHTHTHTHTHDVDVSS